MTPPPSLLSLYREFPSPRFLASLRAILADVVRAVGPCAAVVDVISDPPPGVEIAVVHMLRTLSDNGLVNEVVVAAVKRAIASKQDAIFAVYILHHLTKVNRLGFREMLRLSSRFHCLFENYYCLHTHVKYFYFFTFLFVHSFISIKITSFSSEKNLILEKDDVLRYLPMVIALPHAEVFRIDLN
jgi:hypothetical protein